MLDGVTGLELGGIFIDVKVGDPRDIWIGFVNVLRHQKIMQSRQLSHSYSSVSGATRIASLASSSLSAPEVFCLRHTTACPIFSNISLSNHPADKLLNLIGMLGSS